MQTWRDALKTQHGPDLFLEKARRHLDELVDPNVPEPYRKLTLDILLRLPDGWGRHVMWRMEVGDVPPIDGIFAGTSPDLPDPEDGPNPPPRRVVRLVPDLLAPLTNEAVQGVIVHELAHVFACHQVRAQDISRKATEDIADGIAELWGFAAEIDAINRELRLRAADR
jgi:predicted Zn-dependent protease with MMP-like domain